VIIFYMVFQILYLHLLKAIKYQADPFAGIYAADAAGMKYSILSSQWWKNGKIRRCCC